MGKLVNFVNALHSSTKRNYVDKYWDKIPVLLKGESELLWPFDKNDISNFLEL